jgi:hypothetical protein
MSVGTKERVVGYLNENWGALLVAAALILLLYVQQDVAADNTTFANEVSIYAYFALVAGIVLQMMSGWSRRGPKPGQKQ